MALSKVSMYLLLNVFTVAGSISGYVSAAEESESKEFVVTLDHSNFTDFVAKHKFVVVEFYAPRTEQFDAFKSKYHEVAELYKGKHVSFLMGDVEASQGAFQYFGLKEEQVPLIIIQTNDGQKYLKPNVEPDQIASWVKDFKGGIVQPYKKSEPIPEVNKEPVKVVVADSLQDVVFNSGQNVLLEFYAPWCGHCKKLAPILDAVDISFENDLDVMVAKIDATANDIPSETFDVKG